MKNSGQSLVEYILLLSVMTTIIFSVINSRTFQNFFGEDSGFFSNIERYTEYSFRHAREGMNDPSSYNGNHDSYRGAESHFFSPAEQYPKDN